MSGASNNSGRSSSGRFTKGNRAAAGHVKRVTKIRQEIVKAASEEIVDVVRAMIVAAIAGDVQAARLLLEYAVGRPGRAVDDDVNDRAIELRVLLPGQDIPVDEPPGDESDE